LNKKGFTNVEHLSDTGIEFYGDSLEKLFENAARGMFSIIINIDSVTLRDKIKISLTNDSDDLEDLLILWLERLIYYFETESTVFAGFEVKKIKRCGQGYKMDAEIMGEKFDSGRHEIKIGIKAPTYHQLAVKNMGQKWWGRVIFDI